MAGRDGVAASVLDDGGVRVDRDGAVLTVTLARPDARNAQTPATWRALAAVGDWLGSEPDVRVVLLKGEGASFSAGLDRRMFGAGVPGEPALAELAALDDAALGRTIEAFQGGFSWWRSAAAVSIACVQGHAVGAGFQLALACDLRIVADDATFSMRETTLGLVPDLCGTKPLVDAVGYPRALEICATGRWVGAAEAVSLGLAQAVVPRTELDAAADDLAAALLGAPAGAVKATKELLAGAAGRDHPGQQAAERAAQAGRLRALVAALSA